MCISYTGRTLLKQVDLSPEEERVYQTFLDEWSPRVGAPLGDSIESLVRSGDADLSSTTALRRSIVAEVDGRQGAMQAVISEVGEDGIEAGRAIAGRQFGIEVAFGNIPSPALEELDDWAVAASQSVSDTVSEEMTNYLRRAHEEGLDIEEIAEQFNSEYVNGRLNASHAEQLARDTTVGPANQGRHTAIQDSSAVGEEWITSIDGRERDEHGEADGQIAPVDGTFLVGGEELRYPHDPNGSVWNVTNCRCVIRPLFESDLTEEQIETLEDGGRLNT